MLRAARARARPSPRSVAARRLRRRGKDDHAANPPAQPYSKRSTAAGRRPARDARPTSAGRSATYRRYVRRQLGAMLGEVARAARRHRAPATWPARARAWLTADARYESIGAAYGAFGDLDAAHQRPPGGLPGGVRSPDFTGLHRIELALWGQRSTRDAAAPAARLASDVARLRATVATIEIDPLEYSLRAHEVLEDALHLQLSGQREPVERRRRSSRCAPNVRGHRGRARHAARR